jgi:hypothetical protein
MAATSEKQGITKKLSGANAAFNDKVPYSRSTPQNQSIKPCFVGQTDGIAAVEYDCCKGRVYLSLLHPI